MTDLRTELEALVAAEEARIAEAHARWDAEGRTFITGKPWRISGIIGTQALRELLAQHPAPTADRDEVAEAIFDGLSDDACVAEGDCERAADALLARFDIRRKA